MLNVRQQCAPAVAKVSLKMSLGGVSSVEGHPDDQGLDRLGSHGSF